MALDFIEPEEPEAPFEPVAAPTTPKKPDKLDDETLELPYTPPEFDRKTANANPLRELAARTLCRRRLMPFIKRFRVKYDAGWVHEDICRRLEQFVKDIEDKKSPRLLLMMPPRGGKSEIGSRHFPPWILGQHPEWEVIAASHTASLTLSFSRYIRDLMRDPAYHAVFPETKLDPSSQSVENWNLTSGGGYLAAGVGTGITGRGAHCFVAATRVLTSSGYVKICSLNPGDEVLGYDHEKNKVVSTKVSAVKISQRQDLIEVTTSAGRSVVSTADHPYYVVGRGYVAAELLGEGAKFIVSGLPSVRQGETEDLEALSPLLPRGEKNQRRAVLQFLQEGVSETALRVQEVLGSWAQGLLLLEGLLGGASRRKERKAVRNVPASGHSPRTREGCDVLFASVPEGRTPECENTVRGLWTGLQAAKQRLAVLLAGVFERGAQLAHAWLGEFELQTRGELQHPVLCHARVGFNPRREQVPGLRLHNETAGSPHKPRAVAQPAGESDNSLWQVPRGASQVREDTVSVVKRVGTGFVDVYDLQVAGTENFFAEEILVHNCLLLDDLVKDIEAADSINIRDNTWEWYGSTAYTRLAPGGGVLAIMTWWHENDWAGRVQEVMKSGDGDTFEIVRYPAINEDGDEYILEALPGRPIQQFPKNSPPPPEGSVLTRKHNTALHPARYDTKMMLGIKGNLVASGQKRIWSALYQQAPAPEDGLFFTKDMFRHFNVAPPRHGRTVVQAWDFAITEGEQNDYTVGATIMQDEFDNLYVLDIRRFKSGDSFFIIDAILDYARDFDADLLGFEDGQIWKSISSIFTKRCDERKQYPSFETLVPLTDKLVRAGPLRGRMQGNKVLFNPKADYYTALEHEMLRFPAGKHDDQIDALAWAVRLVLARAAPRLATRDDKLASWKDKLVALEVSGVESHMAA